MKKGPVYLHLSLVRKESPRKSRDQRTVGPVFGPYQAVRFGIDGRIYMEKSGDSASDVLLRSDNTIHYEGVDYPEWSVRAELGPGLTAFDPAKIAPRGGEVWRGPAEKVQGNAPSSDTLEKRFHRLVLMFECAVEDRLSILREDDFLKREELLTSDIDDQIGHWESIQNELTKLKGES